MIKGLSAITKYRNGITKIKATDKLSVKSIILPDVHESDDSTINFTKRVGGEMIQCYSLSEVKLKQPNLCMPTFKEIIFKPCRASSVTTEVFCEPSVLSFSTVKILDYDISFTTRNTTVIPEYDYETGTYIPGEFPTTPLTLSLTLKDIEGFWSLKRNNELLYSSEQMPPLDTNREIYEGGDFDYDIKFSLDIGEGSVGAVNIYEFKGKVSELGILTRNNAVATGELEITRYDSINIPKYKFTTINVDLILPDYFPNHITTAKHMFFNSSIKDSSLSSWDVSNVMNMSGMFSGVNFKNNVDLSSWVTTKVKDMSYMFEGAFNFNKDISGWDVSNVTNMEYMFSSAVAFNQDLSQWCVELIPTLPSGFDTDTPNWTLPKPVWGECPSGDTVENNSNLIFSVESLENPTGDYPLYVYMDTPVGDWSLKESGSVIADSTGFKAEHVTLDIYEGGVDIYLRIKTPETKHYELDATAQYIDISYDTYLIDGMTPSYVSDNPVGKVDITQFSRKAPQFTTGFDNTLQTVPEFLPPELVDTSYLFNRADWFNQDISMWDVSNVVKMDNMFEGAKTFNQDLSQWCVSNITTKPTGFDSNATSWTLPKPEWGTCPSDEDGLVFSVQDINSNGTEFEVWANRADKPTNPTWYLKNLTADTIVASADGFVADGYTVADSGYILNITIPLTPNVTRYAFTEVATYAGFGYYSDNDHTEDYPPKPDYIGLLPEINLTVESFSTTMDNIEFYCDYANITVPEYLPPNMTNLDYMFDSCYLFNQDISMWDVSNVTTMVQTFYGTSLFNQDLSTWDVSNVTDMYRMFSSAISFNQDLSDWDVSNVTSMIDMFCDATSFNGDVSTWDTSNVVGMYNMFDGASVFNQDVSSWDTSSVINMYRMFRNANAFNSNISNWDTSKVTEMARMFHNATTFNQDLSQWCVSNIPTKPDTFDTGTTVWTLPKPVWGTCPSKNEEATIPSNEMHFTTLAGSADYVGTQGDQILLSDGTIVDVTSADETTTFVAPAGRHKVKLVESADRSNFVSVGGGALVELHNFPTLSTVTSFNFSTHEYNDAPNLTKVPEVFPSNIINIEDLFNTTENFNQDISMWDVSNVKIFDYVFSYTPLFNHPLNSWDVSGATSMYALFVGAPLFDQPLDNWDVSNVTNMSRMFDGARATAFNQDISMWNTSNVTNMRNMFNEAITFNQPLDNWNTSNVTDMSYMFFNATSFNQDISSWDVSNVTDMEIMFYDAAAFNQDISSWNTSKVTNMGYMFNGAAAFNQDLSEWCVTDIATKPTNFDTSATSWTLPKPVWGTCPRGEDGVITGPPVDLTINNIGIQGEANFGIGITDNLPNGMSELEGTRILGHENYGNYQYSDGSIMCWIPKFYYRWGGSDSPYAAEYGLNSCDVKSKYDFDSVESANAEGYALHRAFYDNGEVKEGFFVDKYTASNNSGVASSIKNGNPLSISPLNNPLSYLNGSPQNAVYGIIKAAKSRGVDFFPQTNFIKFALSMLSLAHGQASNSNTFCAWFDSTKVSNYPKGYSTETLESPSDPEVVYQPTGFIKEDGGNQLGKTGSASNFAKTTHNGQKSGVADCFEGVSEYLIGLTQYAGKVYSLKTTTKVSNLTDSKTANSGAWGLTGIGNNYDLLGSGFEAFTAADPSIHRDIGVNSNQVFSSATDGLSWAASCGGIPKLDSTGIVSSSDDRGGSQLFAKSRVLDKAFIDCVTLSSGWSSSYHFGRDDASNNYSLFIFRSALYI